jgi:hypothetical protein
LREFENGFSVSETSDDLDNDVQSSALSSRQDDALNSLRHSPADISLHYIGGFKKGQ